MLLLAIDVLSDVVFSRLDKQDWLTLLRYINANLDHFLLTEFVNDIHASLVVQFLISLVSFLQIDIVAGVRSTSAL